MIRLAQVIDTFEADFLAPYRDRLTSDYHRALAAIARRLGDGAYLQPQ